MSRASARAHSAVQRESSLATYLNGEGRRPPSGWGPPSLLCLCIACSVIRGRIEAPRYGSQCRVLGVCHREPFEARITLGHVCAPRQVTATPACRASDQIHDGVLGAAPPLLRLGASTPGSNELTAP